MKNFDRRAVLKMTGMGVMAIALMPRVSLAARNALTGLRVGTQPGGKTRLVIETTSRASYSINYPQNQLVVSVANTPVNNAIRATIPSGVLINSVSQVADGDRLKIVANLNKPINQIPKNGIMQLEPNGDSDYRLVLDFAAGSGAPIQTNNEQRPARTSRRAIVVIDAGHGGKDPGALGKKGTREKDVVLSVAKKLHTKLRAEGYRAYLTRDKDVFLNLDTRAGIAEKHKADLFLSIHANANPSNKMKGFSIYTLSKVASDEEARKLAEAENASDKISVDGFEKFEADIRNALSALQQQAVSQMSIEFANNATKQLKNKKLERQPGPDVRQAPFAVLRSTIPGALVEIGHLSNAGEETLLKSGAHQDKIVAAITSAIGNYKFE